MKMFKENAQKVLTFLQENPNVDLTSKELAEALGVANRSMVGVLNGLVKKGLVVREEVEMEEQTVKLIRLTEEGKVVDPLADKPEQSVNGYRNLTCDIHCIMCYML